MNSLVLSFLYSPTLTSIHGLLRKTIALTRRTFVGKVMSLLFNVLSMLIITFLPRSKCLLILWLQLPSAVILEPPKIKSAQLSQCYSDLVSLSFLYFITLALYIYIKSITYGGLLLYSYSHTLIYVSNLLPTSHCLDFKHDYNISEVSSLHLLFCN